LVDNLRPLTLKLLSRDAKFYLQNAKCGKVNLRKIIKFVATRCQILRLKCTKFNFDWGCAPDPAGGAYSAPRPPPGFRGPTSKGKGRKGQGEERGEGEGEKEKGWTTPIF